MKLTICIILLFAVVLTGCGNMVKGTGIAQAQVAVFHQQLDDQKLDAIISGSDPDLLKGTSKTEVMDFLSVVHRKLGNVKGTRTTNCNVQTFNAVTTVVLTQETEFDRGKGIETFAFRIKNQKAYLAGYNINSRDLIMK